VYGVAVGSLGVRVLAVAVVVFVVFDSVCSSIVGVVRCMWSPLLPSCVCGCVVKGGSVDCCSSSSAVSREPTGDNLVSFRGQRCWPNCVDLISKSFSSHIRELSACVAFRWLLYVIVAFPFGCPCRSYLSSHVTTSPPTFDIMSSSCLSEWM
jgi:hypothetical protein